MIEKKPFRNYKNFDTLSGKGHFIEASEQQKYMNTAIAFEFLERKQVSLLNVDLDLYVGNCIFNAIITGFSEDGDKETGDFTIHLATAPGKKMYESVRYFLSQEQLDAFRSDQDHITTLRKATEIDVLL